MTGGFTIAIYLDTTCPPTSTFEVRKPAPEVGITGKGGETPAPDTGKLACTVDSVKCTTVSLGADGTDTKHAGPCDGEKSHEEASNDKEVIALIYYLKTTAVKACEHLHEPVR